MAKKIKTENFYLISTDGQGSFIDGSTYIEIKELDMLKEDGSTTDEFESQDDYDAALLEFLYGKWEDANAEQDTCIIINKKQLLKLRDQLNRLKI